MVNNVQHMAWLINEHRVSWNDAGAGSCRKCGTLSGALESWEHQARVLASAGTNSPETANIPASYGEREDLADIFAGHPISLGPAPSGLMRGHAQEIAELILAAGYRQTLPATVVHVGDARRLGRGCRSGG